MPEMEDKIEQKLLDQISDEPILVSLTLMYTANHKQTEKLNKCKETLGKLVDNILNNPGEEKYRKIRIGNKIFNENVYSIKYSQLLLQHAGFKIKQIPNESDPGTSEDYYVYETSDDSQDLSKLENLKSSLSLAEPVLPELDRDLKIFKVSPSDSSAVAFRNLKEEYEMDDFYNLKVEELIKEQAVRNEALERQGMLRTKAMRERDEQLELRRYNFCLIRVKFPDDFILEALFKTTETLGDVYELVQENLANDSLPFELAGPSLKKTHSSPSNTLAETGLAPAALLYFKLSDSISQDASFSKLNIKNYLKF
jgi:UBX domain-containing protein 6